MITFNDFSVRLAQGQLKNTAAVDKDNKDVIARNYQSSILNLTNQGLIDLSTKFKLVTKQIDLVFETDVLEYPLDDDSGNLSYLVSTDTEVFLTTNFIKILDIVDSDGDFHPHDTNGHIVTPEYNKLRFTAAKILELGTKIRIRYQAKHPAIIASDNINIPPNIETALQLFVSSLYFSHLNGAEHKKTGNEIWAMYIRHIGEDNYRNDSSTSEIDEDTRFTDRGFV